MSEGLILGLVAGLMFVALALLTRVLQLVSYYHAQIRTPMVVLEEKLDALQLGLSKLAADVHSQVKGQAAALYDMLATVEKASDQALFAARRVAGDLAVREGKVDKALADRESTVDSALASRENNVDTALAEREDDVDTATDAVAGDLAASRQRAEDTVGEPGAAADAALRPDDKPGPGPAP